MCSDLHYNKSDIGIVLSIAAILYGVFKCFFGIIGDRYSARYIMSIGLLLSAFMNIFMGFSSTIPAFTVFWALNYCFQSMGGPPCTKLLKYWFSPVEIGTRWSLWSISHEIGEAVTALIAPSILIYLGWRYMFFIPSIVAILLAIFLFNRLRDTPESLNLPSVEKMSGIAIDPKTESDKKVKLTYCEILKMALSNKLVWCVSVANFFLYFGKMTFLTWGPMFLMETRGSTLTSASIHMVVFDIAGLLGGLYSGYLSDKVFKGRRGPISSMCMVIFAALVVLFSLISDSQIMISICMLFIGFVVISPQLLIGVAATDFTPKRAAATANGFTGTLGYAGMSASGVGTGLLADHYGWNCVFAAIVIAALISAALLSLTWNKRAEILTKA
jgi:sugar phosphate permease